MSDSQQDLLRKAWTDGRTGTLSALSEAKAWALREVWRAEGKRVENRQDLLIDKHTPRT